ncbi:hypothetical protein MKZ38_003255 [Zalerion maritima]|uniref:Ribosomal RNA-processing protein 8 n=1 Tax=Zalerion maritima TaxID=339359 RepID=A0AAD5RZB6_9PEZI|nr:hypothetical protein MKZ38_003255 [Zalerion maritima]
MFAVPGWSIGAGKPKAEQEASIAAATKNANGEGDAPGKNRNKKRKRPNDAAVTADNVADYYEKVIEGKDKPNLKRQRVSEGGEDSVGAKQRKDKKHQQKDRRPRDHGGDGDDHSGKPKKGSKDKGDEKKDRNDKVSKKSRHQDKEADHDSIPSPPQDLAPTAAPEPKEKLTPLQAKMRAKLVSARFRYLNETLYTRPSAEALSIFSESPEKFSEYHSGFRRQVSVWPENPVDSYISLILTRSKHRAPRHSLRANAQGIYPTVSSQHLPFTNGRTLLADLGCGDAKIACTMQDLKKTKAHKNLRVDVQSFDLASPSPLVTKADISHLLLKDGSVDIAVFCLALMGTNWLDFVEESWRVLRRGGELWVAEIKSRFGAVGGKKNPQSKVVEHSVGRRRNNVVAIKKAMRAADEADAVEANAQLAVEVDGVEEVKEETDISAFMEALKGRGFLPMHASDAVQMGNKMFVKMFFVKIGVPTRGKYAGHGAEPPAPGKKRKLKFTDGEDDEKVEAKEKQILKPCVYKIR